MISEFQQDEATLYALELLDADEAAAFERQVAADAELFELVHELQETAALLAMVAEDDAVGAPAGLRERVLADFIAHRQAETGRLDRSHRGGHAPALRATFLPWAIAALFFAFSGLLLTYQLYRDRKIAFLTAMLLRDNRDASATTAPAPSDPLAKISFCALDPTPDFATAQPRAAVLWDAVHQQGKLRVNRLAPPAGGRDYQLWVVESGRKDAVSAGVVHVDAEGKADVSFQPVAADGKPVVAVAISLEQAGGSPTNQGPILLLGKF